MPLRRWGRQDRTGRANKNKSTFLKPFFSNLNGTAIKKKKIFAAFLTEKKHKQLTTTNGAGINKDEMFNEAAYNIHQSMQHEKFDLLSIIVKLSITSYLMILG